MAAVVSVYVDPLRVHGNAWGPFLKGSCHLEADSDEELLTFADRLGLKRSWLQPDPRREGAHFDLTPSVRARAVKLGAIDETDWRAGVHRRRARRAEAIRLAVQERAWRDERW